MGGPGLRSSVRERVRGAGGARSGPTAGADGPGEAERRRTASAARALGGDRRHAAHPVGGTAAQRQLGASGLKATARFAGRVAVVTGAGGAIGRATALRLAAEGATVLAVDRDEAATVATVAAIEDAGAVAHRVCADVSVAEDVRRYCDAAAELGGGRVGAFFNNAGIEGPIAPIEDQTEADFDR